MKKVALLLFLSLIFISCEKDYLVPQKEVPEWLKVKISQDEQTTKDSPGFITAYGCWLRYSWQNEFYFEYHNILMSSSPRAISFQGDTLRIWANDVNTDYSREKCCEQYVWKAPRYKEYDGI